MRPALTRHHGADPRYLWPLLAAGMRACADAGPVRLPPEADSPANLRPTLEHAAASFARVGRLEQAHAAMFAAETSRAGHPDLAAWDDAAAWEPFGQPYPLAYALLRGGRAPTVRADRARAGGTARLLAAGRGNREIAAELFISPRTASVHVSNILGKLRVASRGEAAATAYRLHIFDPP